MTDIKISELNPATQANVDDLLEASQVSGPGYVTRRISLDQVSSLVAASEQVQSEIDDAIATTPGAPPTVTTGWPFLPLTGGTLSGKLTINVADSAQGALFRGTTNGVRFVATAGSEYAIEGVDQTGIGSFQPLRVSGSEVRFGVPIELMRLTTQGLGIGVVPGLARLHAFGTGQTTPAVDTATAAGLRSTVYVQDNGVAAGNGGMVMFGAGQGAFATIKGHILSGATNTAGDLVVSTRRAVTDATLTETARFKFDGSTTLAGALTGTTATFSTNTDATSQVLRMENASTGASSVSNFLQVVGGTKFINRNLSYAGNYIQESGGGGVVTRYSDFDTHNFRTSAGVTQLTIISGQTRINNTIAPQAGGTLGVGYMFSSTANFGINYGSGVPDKAMARGSLYLRSDGTGTPYYNSDGTGAGWLAVGSGGGAATAVGPTPPGSPTDGQLWFFTDASVGGGNLYVRYNDGSSTAWVPASTATAGSVVQTVSFQTGAVATGTTIIPNDDTIPQITEGTEFLTCAITPRSATSRLLIEVVWNGSSSVSGTMIVALFQDSTANALAVVTHAPYLNGYEANMRLTHIMTSGTTSATTFRVRAGENLAGTTTFNGGSGARKMGGVMASSIVIQEVL